jgi:hypothetical protein
MRINSDAKSGAKFGVNFRFGDFAAFAAGYAWRYA